MKIAKFFGKKQVLMAGLVLALGVAVYLNYFFSGGDPTLQAGKQPESEPTTSHLGDASFVDGEVSDLPVDAKVGDYFASARANRTAARKEAVELLQEAISDQKIGDEEKKLLTGQMSAIAEAVEKEAAVEALILAKGFEDCVVFIEDGNCTAVVKAEQLTDAQALQISEIISEKTKFAPSNIKISARI